MLAKERVKTSFGRGGVRAGNPAGGDPDCACPLSWSILGDILEGAGGWPACLTGRLDRLHPGFSRGRGPAFPLSDNHTDRAMTSSLLRPSRLLLLATAAALVACGGSSPTQPGTGSGDVSGTWTASTFTIYNVNDTTLKAHPDLTLTIANTAVSARRIYGNDTVNLAGTVDTVGQTIALPLFNVNATTAHFSYNLTSTTTMAINSGDIRWDWGTADSTASAVGILGKSP